MATGQYQQHRPAPTPVLKTPKGLPKSASNEPGPGPTHSDRGPGEGGQRARGRLGSIAQVTRGKLKCSHTPEAKASGAGPLRPRARLDRGDSAGFPRDPGNRHCPAPVLLKFSGTCPISPAPVMDSWARIPQASLPDPQKSHPVLHPVFSAHLSSTAWQTPLTLAKSARI